MLRIRTRGEKYQMLTSIKRATFECTEVSFIELLKKNLRLLNCSPSELLQAITDMKEFIVCVWTKTSVGVLKEAFMTGLFLKYSKFLSQPCIYPLPSFL